MEVILKSDVDKLGLRGEVVETSPRRLRGANFLLPRGLAEVATPALVKETREARRTAKHATNAQSVDEAARDCGAASRRLSFASTSNAGPTGSPVRLGQPRRTIADPAVGAGEDSASIAASSTWRRSSGSAVTPRRVRDLHGRRRRAEGRPSRPRARSFPPEEELLALEETERAEAEAGRGRRLQPSTRLPKP